MRNEGGAWYGNVKGAVLTFVQREETVRCRSQEDSHFFRDFGG